MKIGSAKILAACLSLCLSLYAGTFSEDTAALTSTPTRLLGTPGNDAAHAYVISQLKEAGLAPIEQPFRFAKYAAGRNELVAAGKSLQLQPMAPNMIIPPVTPLEGVTGWLIDVGDGSLANYPHPLPDGMIVVMDYANGDRWRDAFRCGAQAVIFVGAPGDTSRESQHSLAPANLIRAYYGGPRSALPVAQTVTLHVSANWAPTIATNVIAVVRGTDPIYDEDRGPESVILSAPLDSSGEVPHRAPGARNAANMAALLQIARDYQANPPRRNTIFAFLDADAWGHLGAGYFYRIFEREKLLGNAALSIRQTSSQDEQSHWETVLEQLAQDDPFSGDKGALILKEMQDLASEKVDRLNEDIGILRLAQERDKADHAAEIEDLATEKTEWNTMRRFVATEDPADFNETVDKRRSQLITEFQENIQARKEELATKTLAQVAEAAVLEQAGGPFVSLHISLALSDASEHWGVAIGGASLSRTGYDIDGLYSRIGAACQSAAADCGSEMMAVQSFDGSLARGDAIMGTSRYTHSGAIAGMQGIYNISLATVFDSRPREGTPQDTVAALNLPRLAALAADLQPFLRKLIDEPMISSARGIRPSAFYLWPEFDGDKVRGALAVSAAGGSSMPNKRTVNVMVWSQLGDHAAAMQAKHIPGFHDGFFAFTDHSGALEMGPFPSVRRPSWVYGFAATFDDRGAVTRALADDSASKLHERMNLFDVSHGAVILPATLDATFKADVLDARTDGKLEPKRSAVLTTDGVTSWFCPKKITRVKLFQAGHRATISILGAEGEVAATGSALGKGIPVSGKLPSSVVSSAAIDLWTLNESRLDLLRNRGISNQSLEELHGRAQDLIRPVEPYTSSEIEQAAHSMALGIQHRSYTPVRAMLDDLVKAVLVLLALSVPFAFSLERLLLGSTKIHKQILWFVGFFLATFLLLYVSHPAFAISQTPVIIFLGFTIIVLAAMVIVIIMQRFQTELRVLQGLETTVHAADVSRLGTILAAMSMGVSSMRRRPLRTALTALTIILLTFTILGFASFGAERAVLQFYVQPAPAYPAVSTHDLSWEPIPEETARTVSTLYQNRVTVTTRRWNSAEQNKSLQAVLGTPDGSRLVNFDGILGIGADEAARRPEIAEILKSTAAHEQSVWLTAAAAQRVGVAPGDSVIFNGQSLIVGALLPTAKLTSLEDIDGSSILPVDFSQEDPMQAPAAEDLEAAANVAKSFTAIAADAVVIVGTETARKLNAPVRGIFLYPDTLETADELAQDLARALPLPVTGTRADGVYRNVLGTALAASGVKSLFFPLLLGGLVIFGTMLGSVADRKQEIYTFSALGLAPPHVAGLFFAEALIYSIIGGLGGYLLAQGSMKGLELVANTGMIHLPEMNFSSTNAIVTIVIVMGTVMISAIYPAIRASKSANPGVLRSWKPPAPVGDCLSLTFPFTVSQYDITGVVSFLREHFDACSDVGMGAFMTRSSSLKSRDDGQLQLDAQLALAPFDLGVTQSFSLFSKPSDIEGIDEVGIEIVRQSGQPRDWARQNKVLLDDLRTQFLLWRALPKETVEMYRLRTLESIGGGRQAAQSGVANG